MLSNRRPLWTTRCCHCHRPFTPGELVRFDVPPGRTRYAYSGEACYVQRHPEAVEGVA